jgi:bifunctional non-homologous end joining protein LigD
MVSRSRKSDVFEALPEEQRDRLRSSAPPRRVVCMLASLRHEAFSDPEWLFERKLDGVRCLVFRRGEKVRLVSRRHEPMNDTWPELVDAVSDEACDDFVVDGEIVAFEDGVTSFARLQQRLGLHDPGEARRSPVAAFLYLFDVLHLLGHDVTALRQRERKALLRRALSFEGHLRYTPHRVERGRELIEEACSKGWEGLIAKRADAPYHHGRSRNWLKLKCVSRQELVIGGYTEPRGSRHGFGARLVGYYEKGRLRYAGKVGTGYDDELLARLGERGPARSAGPPPSTAAPTRRGCTGSAPRWWARSASRSGRGTASCGDPQPHRSSR